MTNKLNFFKEKLLFPITGGLFALYWIISSIDIISTFINMIRNGISYGFGGIRFNPVLSIVSAVILNFAILAFAVLAFIKKPKIAFAGAALVALTAAFIDSINALITIFSYSIFGFTSVIINLINFTSASISFVGILVLLLVALNASLKKSNKIVAMGWVVPAAAVICNMSLSFINGLISLFVYKLNIGYIFTGLISPLIPQLIWAVCLLFLGYCIYNLTDLPKKENEDTANEESTEEEKSEAIEE